MKDNYESLRLDNQLCFPLYAVSKEIIRKYRPFLDKVGITYTQYIALMVIWEHEKINVKDLGAELFLDSGTLTPVLKNLESKGYVKRVRNKGDERVLTVSSTALGDNLRDKLSAVPKAVASSMKLDKAEAMELYKLLYKVLINISEE